MRLGRVSTRRLNLCLIVQICRCVFVHVYLVGTFCQGVHEELFSSLTEEVLRGDFNPKEGVPLCMTGGIPHGLTMYLLYGRQGCTSGGRCFRTLLSSYVGFYPNVVYTLVASMLERNQLLWFILV